ncbi:hypothetical protein EYF88_12845 [Paracoccus sediminis]|uniref:Uncharacterized protein n=1 Tax=Paracoccus sediminis TaxID=1214787 RepID=A0A238X761_9RHOB|nr:hypothetical protein [Paracoccus sediminis]TBN48992.1 hypothetical protein EYF88_12845 [Paracoccus sediminis]SNR54550.1 hypothetical protein SAMN06265378_10874 [Paracoccus sediminis]
MTPEYLFQATLLAASLGLGAFCMILSRRLRRLNDLETGLGGAIAVMAAEVDRLDRAIRGARAEATEAGEALSREIAAARTERALWDLRQKITLAQSPADLPAAVAPVRRLRKRVVVADA